VFFAEVANASERIEIYLFAAANEEPLREYLEPPPHGIPSHDTIQRVFAMVSPKYPQEFRKRWNKIMSGGMSEKIKKTLALDGKTRRDNGNDGHKANRIVSAVDNGGFCIGGVPVDDESNEITAISEPLKRLNVQGAVIMTDAMGCQTEIVRVSG
jgi:predicted transposase YbfD/YdcC